MVGSYEFHKMYQAAGALDIARLQKMVDLRERQTKLDPKALAKIIRPSDASEEGGMSTMWLVAGVAGLGVVGYLVYKAVA